MHVAVIGATGMVGSRITKELISRGHTVTRLSRSGGDGSHAVDANDADLLSREIAGHAAVISASNFRSSSVESLIKAVKQANVPRLLVVGGAASLEVSPGVVLEDTPGFPDEYRVESGAGRKFLEALRKEKDLDWTYLSPSAEFYPGSKTGKFRIGKNQLLSDEKGRSHISVEDYAVAMVDEVENPQHSGERFTVGY